MFNRIPILRTLFVLFCVNSHLIGDDNYWKIEVFDAWINDDSISVLVDVTLRRVGNRPRNSETLKSKGYLLRISSIENEPKKLATAQGPLWETENYSPCNIYSRILSQRIGDEKEICVQTFRDNIWKSTRPNDGTFRLESMSANSSMKQKWGTIANYNADDFEEAIRQLNDKTSYQIAPFCFKSLASGKTVFDFRNFSNIEDPFVLQVLLDLKKLRQDSKNQVPFLHITPQNDFAAIDFFEDFKDEPTLTFEGKQVRIWHEFVVYTQNPTEVKVLPLPYRRAKILGIESKNNRLGILAADTAERNIPEDLSMVFFYPLETVPERHSIPARKLEQYLYSKPRRPKNNPLAGLWYCEQKTTLEKWNNLIVFDDRISYARWHLKEDRLEEGNFPIGMFFRWDEIESFPRPTQLNN